MNNLKYLRELSGTTPNQLAKLLNISVHSYKALEQGRLTLSKIHVLMLGKIFSIDHNIFLVPIEKIDEPTINKIHSLSSMSEEQRYEILCGNLTDGKCLKVTYRDVRKAKEKLESSDACEVLLSEFPLRLV